MSRSSTLFAASLFAFASAAACGGDSSESPGDDVADQDVVFDAESDLGPDDAAEDADDDTQDVADGDVDSNDVGDAETDAEPDTPDDAQDVAIRDSGDADPDVSPDAGDVADARDAADTADAADVDDGNDAAGGDVVCETLLAARLAMDADLPNCHATPLRGTVPEGCDGLSANACAEALFVAPVTSSANREHSHYMVMLPQCADGTDSCAPEDRVRCADGSRAYVYVDKAIDDAGADIDTNDWIFVGDASGPNCDSARSCENLYTRVGVNGMSSYRVSRSHDGSGVLAANPNLNPFHRYNRVFVDRCTSDSLAGRGAPISSVSNERRTYTAPIFHHGALVYESAFSTLATAGGLAHNEAGESKRLPDFSMADHVALVGFSGSSRGLAHNGDAYAAVIARLSGGDAEVSLIFDAAFSPSIENELHWDRNGDISDGNSLYTHARDVPTSAAPIQMEVDEDGPGEERISTAGFETGGATREGLSWWGADPDASCVEAHGADYAWECAEREHVMANHLTTPSFIAHRLFDSSETGSPMGVPVHGWMHSRAACQAERSLENCYNWHDDDYRDRSLFQLTTMMREHASSGEESPYPGVYGAFATALARHEGLVATELMGQRLVRCDPGPVPGSEIRLVDAVLAFVERELPNYWHALEGIPHPDGGIWASPDRCR